MLYNIYIYYIYMSIYSTFYPMISDSPPAIQPEIIAAPCSTVHPRFLARRKRLEPGKSVEICGNLWKSHGKSVKYGKITRDSLVFAVLRRFYMILATKIWGGSCNSYNQEADSCLGLWIGSEWVDSVRTFPRLGMIQMTGVQVALFILVDRCELVGKGWH